MTEPYDIENEAYELTMEDFEELLGWHDTTSRYRDFFAHSEKDTIGALEQAAGNGQRAIVFPRDSDMDLMLSHWANEGRSSYGGGAGASASYILDEIRHHGGSLEKTIRDMDVYGEIGKIDGFQVRIFNTAEEYLGNL